MIKCLLCGNKIEVGEPAHITLDGFICDDCVLDYRFVDNDDEEYYGESAEVPEDFFDDSPPQPFFL